jgi:hypothetical protein
LTNALSVVSSVPPAPSPPPLLSGGLRGNTTTRASTGAAGGLLGLTLAAKDAGRDAVKTQITDLASLASAQAAAVKEYVNKKLSDYIRSVQAASALTQQVRGRVWLKLSGWVGVWVLQVTGQDNCLHPLLQCNHARLAAALYNMHTINPPAADAAAAAGAGFLRLVPLLLRC